jgi:hypothetical protein
MMNKTAAVLLFITASIIAMFAGSTPGAALLMAQKVLSPVNFMILYISGLVGSAALAGTGYLLFYKAINKVWSAPQKLWSVEGIRAISFYLVTGTGAIWFLSLVFLITFLS